MWRASAALRRLVSAMVRWRGGAEGSRGALLWRAAGERLGGWGEMRW